ncbi:RteC domain-containing protein [Bacteroides thetaiotaomicron]|uniref:RteC domain-containing protein n=1 Tax=Bacteroides thetaiotaomicron TaxID=818 RepID=UPI002164F5B9|nr:RteC domain-containing protein [Bacteroides thetaiotaomicron]MCS2713656.1 RteC domain-containing protein [Bacteroides thetaiotaomicron]MCS2873855.1 RteC domain-containing protein [Bacteroides thetaiotaomicron]MDL2215241.1 RteC domain-containing protein [Dysgonomonas sp. OttesenSCG-928-M03]
MNDVYTNISKKIQAEIQIVDIEECDISIEESVKMIRFLEDCLSELRNHFLLQSKITVQDEIVFFKEMKPEILGLLLYFNEIHNIELKRPIGSNETQSEYYDKELKSLTNFFERNLDFHQYYRANSTYLDEYYFVRGKSDHQLCTDSTHYILDPLFSTEYDYKVAKIICNEMLRIYLNKKKHRLEKQEIIKQNRKLLPEINLQWTGSKAAATELGYAIRDSGVLNYGNVDVKEIMSFIETSFNIDLGDYYRTYISIKSRKKDRTPFLNKLIESLIRRMENDDFE